MSVRTGSSPGTARREPIPPIARRAARAGAVGTFIEYYDYLLFGVLTVFVAPLFFPAADASVSVLAGLAVYGAGFIAKPVGAVVFGRLGDKRGRRFTLLTTVLMMGVATSLIGALPGYATAGVWAPAMLIALRLLQGMSSGAEMQGATTFVMESAPPSRRAGLAAMVTVGSGLGSVAGSLTAAMLSLSLSPADMTSWGWRIPFLVAVPLTGIAFLLRRGLEDSPEFVALAAKGRVARNPVRDTVVGHRKALLITCMVSLGCAPVGALVGWMIPYLSGLRGLPAGPVFLAYSFGAAVALVVVPVAGRLTDRFGHRRVIVWTVVASIVLMVPVLGVLGTATSPLAIAGGLVVFMVIISFLAPPQYTFMAECFPTAVRFTGSNIAAQVGAVVAGSTTPFLAGALVVSTGSVFAPMIVLGVAGALALLAMAIAPRLLGDQLPGRLPTTGPVEAGRPAATTDALGTSPESAGLAATKEMS